MEFSGRIQKVLPVRSGTSSKGEWKTLPFIFEYFETADQHWSDKVLIETFDSHVMSQIGQYLEKGPDGKAIEEDGGLKMSAEIKCKIGFGHGVKEFNGTDGKKRYTNQVRMYKFEILNGTATVSQHTVQQPVVQQQPIAPRPQTPTNGNDDLPF